MPISLPRRRAGRIGRLAGALRADLRAWAFRRPPLGVVLRPVAMAGLTVVLNGCLPRGQASSLAPTLEIVQVAGGPVAIQDGIPVPSFEVGSRPRIELGGAWRAETATFDSDLSLTPRDAALPTIVQQAAGRTEPDFDDSAWPVVAVPGTVNPPPDRREVGAWYRRTFDVPGDWTDRAVTLKFGAVNYLADVWLNGAWLGYHEGGYTPFAFDAGPALRPGETNVLAVRVDNPAWGTRNDIVPWGLADWWNFGGITRPVWLEASAPAHVVRADVSPHLDGADVSIVLENRSDDEATVVPAVEVLPGGVTEANLLDPDPRALVASGTPLAAERLAPVTLRPRETRRLDTAFVIGGANRWSPAVPSLYVLRVVLYPPPGSAVEPTGSPAAASPSASAPGPASPSAPSPTTVPPEPSPAAGPAVTLPVEVEPLDEHVETFGLRRIAIDPGAPQLRLNDVPIVFTGVSLHDQRVVPGTESIAGGVVAHLPAPAEIREQLAQARSVGAALIRSGHTPADPDLLRLTDRLGFAVWEEIPLYHYTPLTFRIAMDRGIPQQILREMVLRDMNRPSVLFHGFANESTGDDERQAALAELHEIDRELDGTRLTGQAAYGFQPADPTSEPLDVAGYTFYFGVFYGSDAAADTSRAVEAAQARYPTKPLMILEYGRWADPPDGPAEQRRILEQTAGALLAHRATLPGGAVGAAVWWSLQDYVTMRPSIEIERFGLFAPSGLPRPAADAARELYGTTLSGGGPELAITSGGHAAPAIAEDGGLRFLGYLAYAVVTALGALGLLLFGMALRRGRSGMSRAPRAEAGERP